MVWFTSSPAAFDQHLASKGKPMMYNPMPNSHNPWLLTPAHESTRIFQREWGVTQLYVQIRVNDRFELQVFVGVLVQEILVQENLWEHRMAYCIYRDGQILPEPESSTAQFRVYKPISIDMARFAVGWGDVLPAVEEIIGEFATKAVA